MTKNDEELRTLEKVVIIIVTTTGILTLCGITFFSIQAIWKFVTIPYRPFTLNDPQASYHIAKDSNLYWVVYSSQTATTSSLVGRSRVTLDPYLGKEVKITGAFRPYFALEQCILNDCHPVTTDTKGKAIVVDINRVDLARKN